MHHTHDTGGEKELTKDTKDIKDIKDIKDTKDIKDIKDSGEGKVLVTGASGFIGHHLVIKLA